MKRQLLALVTLLFLLPAIGCAAWPTGSISTTNLDQDSDSPLLARPALKTTVDQVNAIRDNGEPLLKSTYTAVDILNKLKTVDGPSSALDADLLDGAHADTTATANSVAKRTATGQVKAAPAVNSDEVMVLSQYTAADVLTKIKTVDGAGSLLDADKLDGKNWVNVVTSSMYLSAGACSGATLRTAGIHNFYQFSAYTAVDYLGMVHGSSPPSSSNGYAYIQQRGAASGVMDQLTFCAPAAAATTIYYSVNVWE